MENASPMSETFSILVVKTSLNPKMIQMVHIRFSLVYMCKALIVKNSQYLYRILNLSYHDQQVPLDGSGVGPSLHSPASLSFTVSSIYSRCGLTYFLIIFTPFCKHTSIRQYHNKTKFSLKNGMPLLCGLDGVYKPPTIFLIP